MKHLIVFTWMMFILGTNVSANQNQNYLYHSADLMCLATIKNLIPGEIYGDVNCDGKITARDVNFITTILNEGLVLKHDCTSNERAEALADMNQDGLLTDADARVLNRLVLGTAVPLCGLPGVDAVRSRR